MRVSFPSPEDETESKGKLLGVPADHVDSVSCCGGNLAIAEDRKAIGEQSVIDGHGCCSEDLIGRTICTE